MTAKEGIEAIKKLLFSDPAAPVPAPAPVAAAPVKMEQVSTVDGVVLSIDKKEVGGSVMIDGVAAPDAEYQLNDGTFLTVAGGLITAVETKGSEAVDDPNAVAMAAFKLEFESFKGEFSQHKQAFAAVQNELATNKAAFAQLMQVVETMSNASVQQPVNVPKTFNEMSPVEKFRASKQN